MELEITLKSTREVFDLYDQCSGRIWTLRIMCSFMCKKRTAMGNIIA